MVAIEGILGDMKSSRQRAVLGVCVLTIVGGFSALLWPKHPIDSAPPLRSLAGSSGYHPPFESELTEDQRLRFESIAQRIACIHEKRAHGHELDRTYHHKIHGCLKGKMIVEANIPQRARHGIFAQPRSYDVWARFSNINYDNDSERDLRGLAIKVMGVDGERAQEPDRWSGQDFLVNDTRVHFARTPEDVIEFSEYAAEGKLGIARYALRHPGMFRAIVMEQSAKPYSLLDREYYSRAPFHLGPNEVIEYALIPCGTNGVHPRKRSENHLGEDLAANAKWGGPEGALCFRFEVRFHPGPLPGPGEDYDYRKEWKTPPYTLATLLFPPQDIRGRAHQELCQELSFDPWNTITDHAPVGDMNKARWYIYEASRQAGRGELKCDRTERGP
jgi:hypothetical protein